jgi:hypothetical protein
MAATIFSEGFDVWGNTVVVLEDASRGGVQKSSPIVISKTQLKVSGSTLGGGGGTLAVVKSVSTSPVDVRR